VKPINYFAPEHEIDFHLIDQDAIYVIEKLRQAGHEAYLVGGSVRDLLTKKTPKDFDISTSAKPEEIKAVFHRKCILIGRRFRLAHIRFGHKIIEVATFRAGDNERGDLITQDNVFGTAEQDVTRRDFTINGLFYDTTSHSVIDYVGGWEDIHNGILKSIGDPNLRFRQDPVRMIRLLKFAARLGFKISPECEAALFSCKEEIIKSSPSRLLEEILRMLESGWAVNFFQIMIEKSLLEILFPQLTQFLSGTKGQEIFNLLSIVDQIHRAKSAPPIDRAVLTSCLLFPILQEELKTNYLDQGLRPHLGEIMMVIANIIKTYITTSFSHFPRRISALVNYILSTQYRFTPFSGKRHYKPKLFHHKEFPLALKFFKIRALQNPETLASYESWKKLYLQFTHPGKSSGQAPSHGMRRPYVRRKAQKNPPT
jgi:poly(A) polymerase